VSDVVEASYGFCPDRVIWQRVGVSDIWRCRCCTKQVHGTRLVNPVSIEAKARAAHVMDMIQLAGEAAGRG